MGADLLQSRKASLVALDGDDLLRALRQQRAGEAAGAGADLHHHYALQRPGGARDAAGQIEIEQEILAERLARIEPERGDDLAQRRQAVLGERSGGGAHAVSRAASRAAAIRLDGWARPCPAMSKAVP